MPPVRMTRAEYEAQYDVKPVVATSTLDNDPIPVRMTRAEYNALYRPQQAQRDNSALGDLATGFRDAQNVVNQEIDRQAEINQRGFLGRNFGRFASGLFASGTALGAIGEGIFRALPGGTTVANTAQDITESGMQAVAESPVGQGAQVAFKALPEGVQQFAGDVGRGALGALGIGATVVAPGAASTVARPLARSAQETIESVARNAARPRNVKAVERVANEIADIENNYVKTRNKLDRDVTATESRARIAQSNVLDGATDTDGLIRTKQKGGAIDKYKSTPITEDGLTLLDVEDVVKRNLDNEGRTVNVNELKANIYGAVMDSGLEGADLAAALRRVEKDIAGISIRADEFGNVLLSKIQDAKIATTKNIDYTKPVGTTYRKTLARVYKETIENKSDLPVKQWNAELAKYYKDLDRLADLDGKRVKGGRLGKYTANIAGSAIGGVAGATAGAPGALLGGIVGGELATGIAGRAMSRTFRRGVDGQMPKSEILAQANARALVRDLSTPDKQVGAPKELVANMPEPVKKEVAKVEAQIKSNIKQQKAAIAAGDFTLVASLKEVYVILVDRLKEIIEDYKKNGIPLGMSIRKTVTPESVAQKADTEDMRILASVIDDVTTAKTDPAVVRVLSDMGLGRATDDELVAFAKEVFDEKDGIANREVVQRDLNENQAIDSSAPTNAQNISDTVLQDIKSVKTAPPQTTALLEEAKKYKSAEEFVKAQGTPLYHGTTKEFTDLKASDGGALGPGVYFATTQDLATSWGSRSSGNPTKLIEAYLPNDIKLATRDEFRRVRDKVVKDDTASFRETVAELQRQGYSGVIDEYPNGGIEYNIFDPSNFKTRTQLEDIWKQANQK